jgi:hypothetical protein
MTFIDFANSHGHWNSFPSNVWVYDNFQHAVWLLYKPECAAIYQETQEKVELNKWYYALKLVTTTYGEQPRELFRAAALLEASLDYIEPNSILQVKEQNLIHDEHTSAVDIGTEIERLKPNATASRVRQFKESIFRRLLFVVTRWLW